MGQQHSRFRDLAQQLLDCELGHEPGQQATPAELAATMERAFQRLQKHLHNLTGRAGFQALLARAAHLTRKEVVWLERIAIRAEPDLALTGLAERIETEGAAQVMNGLVLLLANLIGLLCTFIGDPLTLLLIRRIWPEVTWERSGSASKEGK